MAYSFEQTTEEILCECLMGMDLDLPRKYRAEEGRQLARPKSDVYYVRDDDRVVLKNEEMVRTGFFGGYSSQLNWAYRNGYSSKEFYQALQSLRENAVGKRRLKFYMIQSLQTLGERNDRFSIPIWIARNESRCSDRLNIASAWIEHIKEAIDDINYAAPGLQLYITRDKSEAQIEIYGNANGRCFSVGFVQAGGSAIYLENNWNEKKRTSCHELLHALGAGHEHQRKDRDYSVSVKDQEEYSYRLKDDILGLTGFDPHSIMIYPEDEILSRNSEDPVWFTKPCRELNREMSELDKVALNNAYRPCKGPLYSPTKRGFTGQWYCGKYFGVQFTEHDGYCGPTNGPNCPACRVLKSDRVEFIQRKGKWQGWTGEVYCGRWFGVREPGHDGYCGPNNGPSCPECYHELLRPY